MDKIKNLLYVALIVKLLSCNNPIQDEPAQASVYCLDSIFKERIELVRPSFQNVEQTIHLTGTVEAMSDRVVSFVSLVSGVVTQTNFTLGDQVKKGQVLAELRSPELSTLTSEFKKLQSQIGVAETKLQSVQSMYNQGISSRKDLMEAQSEVDILRSELARTSEYLELYSASLTDGVFQIRAPATGIVTQKNITAGSQISPESGALFTISDLSKVWVLGNVYATNVSEIHEGMDVNITTLSYRDDQFKGKINAIPSVMDEEEKVLKARIELNNAELKLKPGMHVDIHAFKPLQQVALAVPTRAIVFDDNQHFVIVYKNDCELALQKVDILVDNNRVTYLKAGIDTTDAVVSKNQLLIFEQLKNFQN